MVWYTPITMGIDLDIRKLLVARHATAFTTTSPFPANGGTSYVVVDDVLTRFMHVRGLNEFMFTGMDLFRSFMGPIRDHRHDGAVAYVAICDDFNHIPRQKAATQAARSASRTDVLPYDDGVQYIITSQGMVRSDDTTAEPQLIDIRRLMKTRRLRVKLWQYINRQLSELDDDEFMNDFRIVFEYERNSINLYPEAAGWDTEFYIPHNHGEADTSIVHWANLYPDVPVLVTTIDTDTLPITLNYLQRSQRRAPMYWVYEGTLFSEKKQKIYVDMMELYDRLTIPANAFSLGCILAGNDFFKKKDVAHLLNAECILRACGAAHERQFINNRWRDTKSAVTAVVGVLALLYGQKCGYPLLRGVNPNNLIDEWQKIRRFCASQNARLVLPNDEAIKSCVKRVVWNMLYWKCVVEE